eukprot:TRINITY_DN4379_c0_g1_i2.p1 TRINITY_DN4379_c0_g1~~TRINITY_DN4379_c0_g1_i2.p1  ORF type:complete len:255 (+),score=42.44 TRINITY_DN4379_c0_g1_i2:304-1068(+)
MKDPANFSLAFSRYVSTRTYLWTIVSAWTGGLVFTHCLNWMKLYRLKFSDEESYRQTRADILNSENVEVIQQRHESLLAGRALLLEKQEKITRQTIGVMLGIPDQTFHDQANLLVALAKLDSVKSAIKPTRETDSDPSTTEKSLEMEYKVNSLMLEAKEIEDEISSIDTELMECKKEQKLYSSLSESMFRNYFNPRHLGVYLFFSPLLVGLSIFCFSPILITGGFFNMFSARFVFREFSRRNISVEQLRIKKNP